MQTAVLVVGAGPTGLAAALELARRGLHPRLIDAGEGPTPAGESRALGVLPRTLAILGPSGVGAELRAAANPIRRVEIREAGRRLAAADFAEMGPEAMIHVLPQGDTERLLLAALADRGIAPEWRTRLVGLEPGRARLETPAGAGAARFDRLLGCDGAQSATRRLAGIGFEGESLKVDWSLADLRLAEPRDPGTVSANFLPSGGAFGRIPIDARTARYVGAVPDVTAVLPPGEPSAEPIWTSRFRVDFRAVERFARGEVLLAGDAAHVHSPVGARGMNLGIEDAAWAAWAIAEGREGAYSDARLPVARRTLAETRSQTAAVLGASRAMRLARRHLPGPVFAVAPLRRRALARLLDLDRPLPPWL